MWHGQKTNKQTKWQEITSLGNDVEKRDPICTGDASVCLHAKLVQSCLALCDSVDCSPPGSFVHGILQSSIQEWVAIYFSREFPSPGIEITFFMYPALTGRFLTPSVTWEAPQWILKILTREFVVVQLISLDWLFVTSWTSPLQTSLSFTISLSLLKLMSTESVMPPKHLVLCCPLLLPLVFSTIRVFYYEAALPIRWPKTLELQLQQWIFSTDFL